MALPNGYTQLEYIESTGAQYIDTGFKPNQNTNIFAKVSGWPNTEKSTSLWGTQSSGSDRYDMYISSGGVYRSYFAGAYVSFGSNVSYEDVVEVERVGNTIRIGQNSLTNTVATFSCTMPLYLFAHNNNGTLNNAGSFRLYSCQIYDSGTLARNFVPAKNAQGVAGLYDTVGGTFYPSASSTAFVAGELPSFEYGTKLNTVPVGSTVYANVNGARTPFIVVHKGIPSAAYDASCDGVWVILKDLYTKMSWGNSTNTYKHSGVNNYLNGTFLGLLDGDVRSLVKTVKIPYINNGTVLTGSDGLQTKCFAPSFSELGWEIESGTWAKAEGAALEYFKNLGGVDAKRIAYLYGTATDWFTRSPVIPLTGNDNTRVWLCNSYGGSQNIGTGVSYNEFGVRPMLVFSNEALVDDYGTIMMYPPVPHATLVGGTAYKVIGGQLLVDGTVYEIAKGRTLIDGIGYDIPFERDVSLSYTGTHNIYGDGKKGWIEMLTSGTLTIGGGKTFDVYLLNKGDDGEQGSAQGWGSAANGGDGGNGGAYKEFYGEKLKGEYAVTIGGTGSGLYKNRSSVGSLNAGSGSVVVGRGGAGSNNKVASAGGGGRQPFTGNSPMSQGFAQYPLGAGGGGGGSVAYSSNYYKHASGGYYGGGDGQAYNGSSAGNGKANTGGGGGGGRGLAGQDVNDNGTPGTGGIGIAIVRWGY